MSLQQRQIEFTNYRDYIGMDITSLVALPVWIMMPFSMLQNISEIMEYTDLLEKAAKTEDPYERYVVTNVCLPSIVSLLPLWHTPNTAIPVSTTVLQMATV